MIRCFTAWLPAAIVLPAAICLALASGASAQRTSPAPRWVSEYNAQILAGVPLMRPAAIRNFGPVDLGGGGTRVGNGDEPAIDQMRPAQAGPAGAGAPPVDTTLYNNYYNPTFVGYNSTGYGNHGPAQAGPIQASPAQTNAVQTNAVYANAGGNYASYGGFGYGGHPIGATNYPPWLYRPRYFYPYRYYPLRTGFSVYNPYFFYNNTWYGRYANPYWSGYGGFAFPHHFGAYGPAAAGYSGVGGYGGARGAGYGAMAGYGAGNAGYGGFGYPYRYSVFGYPYPGLFSSTYSYLPSAAYFMYSGLGGFYVPPGYVGFPGYYGYAGYGLPISPPRYSGGLYW